MQLPPNISSFILFKFFGGSDELFIYLVLHYLDTYTILMQNQFEFRQNHSTHMALLSLIDDI